MAYDVVIKNGTVVDGSGRPPYRADVAIQGDRIAEIGKVSDAGKRVIDAEGHIVTNYHVVDGAEDIEVDFTSGFKARRSSSTRKSKRINLDLIT